MPEIPCKSVHDSSFVNPLTHQPCWSGLQWPAKCETTVAWCGSCCSRRSPRFFVSWTSLAGVLRPAHPWTLHTATAQSPLQTKQQHMMRTLPFFATFYIRNHTAGCGRCTHQSHFHLVWWSRWRSCKYKSRDEKPLFILTDIDIILIMLQVCWICTLSLVLPVHSYHHTLRAGLSYRLLDVSHLSLVLTSHQVTCNAEHI